MPSASMKNTAGPDPQRHAPRDIASSQVESTANRQPPHCEYSAQSIPKYHSAGPSCENETLEERVPIRKPCFHRILQDASLAAPQRLTVVATDLVLV